MGVQPRVRSLRSRPRAVLCDPIGVKTYGEGQTWNNLNCKHSSLTEGDSEIVESADFVPV